MVDLSDPEKTIDTSFWGSKNPSVGVVTCAIVAKDFVVEECVSIVVIPSQVVYVRTEGNSMGCLSVCKIVLI